MTQTNANKKYVEAHLRELATFSQSKENIMCTVGMIYDYCTTNETSLDEVTFPCKMKMKFTYDNIYKIPPLIVEIEPLSILNSSPSTWIFNMEGLRLKESRL